MRLLDRRFARAGSVLAVTLMAAVGCSVKPALTAADGRLQIVTTTGLLADMVRNVGGDLVEVASLVPAGADPHSYEPTLRDARNAVYADVAFSNYAMLEEHNVIKTLDANLSDDAVSVSLAEEAVKYAAEIIPLVENVALDTVWLGLRSTGGADAPDTTRSSQVEMAVTDASGPGEVYAYLTGTFGDTDVYVDSANGFDAATGYRDDAMTLPVEAHTHLSWAFSEPGIYELTMRARLLPDATSRPVDIGESTFVFAVGVDPSEAGRPDAVVLDDGHADITADLGHGDVRVRHDRTGGGEHEQHSYAAGEVVISVPPKARAEVPAGSAFAFLGRAGTPIYQLPQAVLGKHVHGEIDPHLWQDARNGMAYVQLIRDTLVAADPEHAADYVRNADAYLDEIARADDHLRERIAAIPSDRRHLVTSHDAFGYLAAAYGVEIAGFVTPNPASEPSLADRRKLSETLRTLRIPAVFLEPNLASRASTLTELAADAGVEVCLIYGDALDETVTGYVELLRFNADSLYRCLGG